MNNNGGTAMSELSEAKAKSRDRAARRKLEAVPAPLPAMTIPVSSRGNGSLLELIEPTKPLRRIILVSLLSREVESLEDSLSLLTEVIATFAVNKDRLKYTEEEFRELYRLYEEVWRPRYEKIHGVKLAVSSEAKGGA